MADTEITQLHENCGQWINTLPDREVLNDTTRADRFAKKQAIRAVKEAILEHVMDTDDIFKAVFLEALWDSLLLWLTSDVDYVREQTVKFLEEYLQQFSTVPIGFKVTGQLVDVIQDRVSHHSVGSSMSFAEPAEDIRVHWLEVAITLLNKCDVTAVNATHIESMLNVVESALEDPFSQVQKVAGNLLIILAKAHSIALGSTGDRPLRLVASLLSHKHSPIRIIALKAAYQVALATPQSIDALFTDADDQSAAFPSLVFDPSANVRSLVYTTAGLLLKDLEPTYRLQYAGKLLPILLASTLDSVTSVSKEGLAALGQLNEICLRDFHDTQAPEHHAGEPNEYAGLSHLLHTSCDACFASITRYLSDLSGDARLKSLGVLALLLKYTNADDITGKETAVQSLFDHLFIAYAKSKDDEETLEKVKDILEMLGAKLPKAMYMSYILPRLEEGTPLHTETISLGPFGLTVTIIMLRHLISTTVPEDLDEDIVGPLFNILDTASFSLHFIEDQQLTLETAHLMSVIIERQDISNTNTLTDTVRFRVVWLGTKLRAASALNPQEAQDLLAGDHGNGVAIERIGSPVIQAIVDRTLRMLIHPTPAVMSVYAHYLPTILGRLQNPRDGKGPAYWTESSVELKMLEVVLSAVDVEALEGEGTPEELVEIFCSAGAHKSKGEGGARDIDAEIGNLMVRQRVLNLLACIFTMDDEYQHFWIYTDYLLEKLFRTGLGTYHTALAASNVTRSYHLALLNCLELGIQRKAFNHHVIQGDIILHMERWLLYVDDDVRLAAVKCSLSLIDYIVSTNQSPETKVACQCLASALLDRLEDNNIQVRRTIIDRLQTAHPGSVFYDPENAVFQHLKECVSKVLETLPESDECRVSLLTLVEQRGLQLGTTVADE